VVRARKSKASARPQGGRIIFTIASANYISYAATLMQSVREHHPEATRYIVLADAPRQFPDVDLGAEILPLSALGIPLIGNMQLWYSITEFNTAIKPFVFRHLFAKGHAEACYLDPDIRLFAPMREAFAALKDSSCVLTPHMTKPLQDGKEPSDLTIMKSGVYNLGFLALRNDAEAGSFLQWWAERCAAHCRIDVAANMFTDQRWMDLAPAFIEQHHILRHPGYNVAYWNLAHRQVERRRDGSWTVNGEPLVFFHFSGIDVGNPQMFSRHQNRFSGDDLGAAGELVEQYRALVRNSGWSRYKDIRYAFGYFPDGRPIEAPMRRWLLRGIDEERIDPNEKLRVDGKFFDAPDETAAARGVTMTRAMYQLWLDRADLRAVFDIYAPEGLENYYNWFLEGNAEADGCDHRTIAAAELLRHEGAEPAPIARPRRRPLWQPIAESVWTGMAADALQFLREDVPSLVENVRIMLPRQAALIWELRPDLQQHYPLTTLDSLHAFVAWALSAGIVEGTIEPALFSGEFVAQLARESRLSLYYRDVPLTEGMLMTRSVPLGRDGLADWRRFPVDRPGRLAHGLWYAFVAPKLFRWPAELADPARRWFAQETEIAWAGFKLNRAELAIWELRGDLQQRFPLSDPRSCWQYLHWLVAHGLGELRLTLDEFDARLTPFLRAISPRFPGLPQVLEMLHEVRPDLRAAIDIATPAGRLDLHAWAEQSYRQAYNGTPAAGLYPPEQSKPARRTDFPVHRAAVGLTGQWSAATGRGEDLRNAAAALRSAGFSDFVVIDRENGQVLRADGAPLPEASRIELATNVVFLNADTALHDWCFLRRKGVTAQRTIGFWAWELERLPAYWRHAFGFFDEIWAATEFARAAFAAEEARPVRRVPLAVSRPGLGVQPSRAELGLPEDATVFLFMFDFHSFASRKNPEAVVQAFLQAFPRGKEKVHLLLKTQSADAMRDAWARLAAVCTDPRIEIRDATMPRDAVLALVRSADAFVSLHRSEGFGRGPAEAMLLGKPVILTGYSGTADFATPDCAYVVDFTLVPVARDEYPGVREDIVVRWAEPDIAMAAAHMRRVHERPEEARGLGKLAAKRIAELYSPAKVGAAMLEALGLAVDVADQLPPAHPGRPKRGSGGIRRVRMAAAAARSLVET
jgi:glycosyltransferase involved in cell wall biosynthesis